MNAILSIENGWMYACAVGAVVYYSLRLAIAISFFVVAVVGLSRLRFCIKRGFVSS